MAVCPYCHTEQGKRKSGCCPTCLRPVEVHGKVWYRTGTGNPNVAVFEYFEQQVSRRLTSERKDGVSVPFSVPRQSAQYKRELIAAERMLGLAEFDLDLVKETITILFTHSEFKWKKRNTMLYLPSDGDFLAALAIARAEREAKKKQATSEQKVVSTVLRREDIFS